jgi:hypothetical protein
MMSTTPPDDWTAWIITTIMAALSTMVGTVIFLAKLIESKYVSEIRDLKNDFKDYKIFADKERQELTVKHAQCMEDHYEAKIRLARLETQMEKNNE